MEITDEIYEKAMEEATKIFGVDPAYFGEEGQQEGYRQLEKLGVDIEKLKKQNEGIK